MVTHPIHHEWHHANVDYQNKQLTLGADRVAAACSCAEKHDKSPVMCLLPVEDSLSQSTRSEVSLQ